METRSTCCYCGVGCGVIIESDDGRITGVRGDPDHPAKPLSLTGQPNAMGGREVGGMANLLPSHRDLANPDHRAEIAALWGVPAVRLTGETAARDWLKEIIAQCTDAQALHPCLPELKGASKNSEFAQMQGAEKICEHPLRGLPAYPTSQRRIWMICKQENEVSVKGNLQVGRN